MNDEGFYVLDENRQPVKASLDEWGKFRQDDGAQVAVTEITPEVHVSTVFLGINHRLDKGGPPLLFETMIFGGSLEYSCWRYSSWDDAVIGHEAAVRKARK